MKSSNETMKVSSRLATIPGSTSGNVTRQNVIHPFSPRSREASSRLASKPSKRDISTRMAKGMQISTWPMTTLVSESGIPTIVTRMSSAMPMTISGMNSERLAKPSTSPRPGSAPRVKAFAASRPRTVETSRRRRADLERVPQGRVHRRVPGHGGVPFGGEAGEREGDEDRIVEREQRQQQHGDVEKGKVENRVDRKPRSAGSFARGSVHRILAVARRSAWMTMTESAATAAMLAIASAAPSGQLFTRPNCTWMMLAIITPSEPPTSVGVT